MFGRMHKLLLTTTALAPLAVAIAVANPLGPQVVGGSVTIQGQGTPNVTVTQQTNSGIINWNTFNIGTGERTNIFMPNSSSVQLDRVTGGLGPSQILGSLWSNGRVFLVNPDGILFGTGATIDTAGFLATTHDIANADFMAGRYNFMIPGRPDASIVNQGTITASNGGFAALVAPGVRNSGTISATLGTVALVSGNGFTLDFYGDRLITLGINDSIATAVKDVATGQTLDALVKNDGVLRANGGHVELTAAAARTVVDSVINNTGVIEANTIGQQNGMIVLSAATAADKPADAPTQRVRIGGTLSAAGKKNGEKGGKIQITGESIEVAGAHIDASGAAGGGTVLIGGDVGGGHPSAAVAGIPQAQLQAYAVPTASNVTVDAATTINASATDTGDGGKVVVWSGGSTSFNGSILARGGATAGNGGFVETSGHTLDFAGARVDASAPNGRFGLWLLDPFNLSIDASVVTPLQTALAGTDVLIQTTATSASGFGVSSSGVGNISVDANISWNSANSLTLSAYRDIQVNANINNGGSGNVTLRADNTGSGVGTVGFNSVDTHISTGGAVSIFYNPLSNPAGSVVNGGSYLNPTDYSGNVTGGKLTAYMLVNTVYDLQNIQNNLSGTYALGRNIDASASASWNGGAGFSPIGHGAPFTGLLDGEGNNIDFLTIHPIANNVDQIGLFSNIGVGGVVQNLSFTHADIRANPNLGTGYQSVGVLAAYNAGLVDNVHADGTIDGGTVSGLFAGGLVGQNGFFDGSTVNGGTIQNSSAAVNITLGDGVGCTGPSCNNSRINIAGGLVGVNPGSIIGSSASGNVVVGANSQAGGLAGTNQIPTGATSFPQPLIDSSFATGNVNSDGINVSLGGLVGYNSAGALINLSYATGNVTATAIIASNNGTDCSISNNCQYASVGGLVGQNSGIILGATNVPVLTQPCVAGQTCATGAVSVGSHGTGGGLVGSNDGIIVNTFATGAVTGAAGTGLDHGGTNLGGLAGFNQGLIAGSHATGDVGSLGVAGLHAGGLVGDNSGTIQNSYATGNVSAGDNSQAGGLTSNNSPNNNFSCNGCTPGDGSAFFNTGLIIDSHATGNVTVGTGSLAGGLSATGDAGSTFIQTSASGTVSGGGGSILGGLIAVNNVGAIITDSTASGSVTSTGSNSWVGGFIGVNAGTISSSSATGAVTGTSDSILGGFAGLNLGIITDSTTATSSTVSGPGANNYIGGFVGVNFGAIDPSTAAGDVTGGANSTIGSFAGANVTLASVPVGLSIPGSSFPVGTISTDSVGTGKVNGTDGPQVGTNSPTSFPAAPSVVASCGGDPLCTLLQSTLTFVPTQPPPPEPPPPITQLVTPVNTDTTNPVPILTDLTLPPTPGGSPPSDVTGSIGPGKSGFVPPPLPPRSVPGPNGETRSSVPPPGENRFFQNQVLLQLGLDISDAELARIAQELGLQIITTDTLTALGRKAIRFQLPPGMSVRDAILRLEANRLVSVAAPVYHFGLAQDAIEVADGDSPQYMLNKLHMDKVHALASGKGVIVAVIDSEADKQHTELQGTISEELDTLAAKEPPHSHGTAMVGAIVSRDKLKGVAPGAKILAVRAFSKSNNTAEGTTISILKGIEWAMSQHARVINMSFAGPRDPSLERALKAAHDKGVVLIAAAGNAGPKSPPLYPAADPNVIAVTATDARNRIFRGANQGPQVSVAAPGVDILAPAPDETYQVSTGTSIAAAHVSGMVALMLELDPTLKPDEVRKILESTATDLGPKGKDNQFGWGLINPQKALETVAAIKIGDASLKN